MDNCVSTTKKLLELLGVKYTLSFIEEAIFSHPEYPSLLCICDAIEKYAIEHKAVKISTDKLLEMPLPCIVQISERQNIVFRVLNSISRNQIFYYSDKGELIEHSKEMFFKKWTGVCLLVETTKASKEVNIDKKLASKRFLTFLKAAIPILLLIWIVICFYNLFDRTNSTTTLISAIFTLLKIVGLIVSGMLLWLEVDEHNPRLHSFCSGGNHIKVNCDFVLNSKYSQLFYGHVSLSLLGFSYFFASFVLLIVTGFSDSSLSLLGYLTLVNLPIILASSYYQGIIIKQWCRFCILAQAVLTLEIGIVLVGGFYNSTLSFETLPLFLAFLILSILVWKLLKPLLEKVKETNVYRRELKRLKNNPNVLHGLLAKSKKIVTSTASLGISFNSANAKYNVIKVCNPYCGPCAKAHPILEELIEKGIINLQILFTANSDENDINAQPVRQFLEIDSNGDSLATKEALNYWYTAENRDYDSFTNRYPVSGQLEKQNEKIKAMHQWCDTENIRHTPTIFINRHELPKTYAIEDLLEALL